MYRADILRDHIYESLDGTCFTEHQKNEITMNAMIFICNEILNKLTDK